MADRFAWPRRQQVAVGTADPEFSDSEEFGKSNLCFPNSCQNPRQQVAVGPADPAISSAR